MIFMHVTNENVDKFNDIAKNKKCFLKYYMPGCGHCIAMEKEWEIMKYKLPNMLRSNNNIIVGEIRNDSIPRLKFHNNILGYPTIAYLNNGKLINEYNGKRTYDKLLEWILNNNKHYIGGKKNKNNTKKERRNMKSRKTHIKKHIIGKKNNKTRKSRKYKL